MRVGAGLVVLAVPYVAWQLHRRGSAEGISAPGETLVDAYRRHLIRQRDAIRSVGSWYIGPFVPGLTLMWIGMWLGPLKPGMPLERKQISLVITGVFMIVVFVGVWLLNQWGARRLQKKIDEL
jgi:hypothetical protein